MTTENIKLQRSILKEEHHKFSRGLHSHAFFKVDNHQVEDDLVQDTFMKTWAYLRKGGQIDIMRAFLYHVLNNLIVDEYRKNKTDSLDALLEKGFESTAGNQEALSSVIDGRAALLLIGQLPPNYQKIMRMRYLQGLSLKEMALITGLSKNTVAVQAHRGLAKLKRIYDHS